MCVKADQVCDGVDDCGDNSDELFCTCETRTDLITCPGGSNFTDCIPKQWICDGHSDCPGGTDEKNCNISLIVEGILNIKHIYNAPESFFFFTNPLYTNSYI